MRRGREEVASAMTTSSPSLFWNFGLNTSEVRWTIQSDMSKTLPANVALTEQMFCQGELFPKKDDQGHVTFCGCSMRSTLPDVSKESLRHVPILISLDSLLGPCPKNPWICNILKSSRKACHSVKANGTKHNKHTNSNHRKVTF